MADHGEGTGSSPRPSRWTKEAPRTPPAISEPLSTFQTFLHQNGLADLLCYFPSDFTLGNFRAVTEDDFEDYGVEKLDDRARLMRAVHKARVEYDERQMIRMRRRSAADAESYESDYEDVEHRCLEPQSPQPRSAGFNASFPRAFPKLNRPLSIDEGRFGNGRRGSLGASLISGLNVVSSSTPKMGYHSSTTNALTLGDSSNLQRMRQLLGQSAPSLTASIKELGLSRKGR
ncbi:uncharacterized protein [Amphiura filiformis]|uniref:uncharacterized protein n=1 Tax=Amphiura filiformis TaxID=82378 RepID=UPI003B21C347